MEKQNWSLIFLALCLMLAIPGYAKKGGKKGGGSIPVMVTFRDETLPPDRIQSDLGGSYIDKEQDVGAGIGNTGKLFMGLNKGNKLAIRTLHFDFSECLLSSGRVHPAFPSGFLSQGGERVHILWHQPDKDGRGRSPVQLEVWCGV